MIDAKKNINKTCHVVSQTPLEFYRFLLDILDMRYHNTYLVGGFNPAEKIWVRQLGLWNSQYMESHNPFIFQTTNQLIFDQKQINI